MLTKYSFVAIIMAVMLIFISTSIAKEIENLLTNPDFEINTAGWSLGNGNPFAIDKKEKSPTGHNVVKATIDIVGANAWEPEIHSPSFDLENGKKYTFSFWAMTEPEKTRMMGCNFEQLDTWVGIGQNITINDEWQEYHFTGLWTHPSSPPQVVVHMGLNNPPGHLLDIWLSHFKVYEGDYVEEEIEGVKPKAVTPADRLATAWGQIKNK